jgi:hypothetical protein
MRKLHWVSMALIAAPVALIIHCGGDDTTPAPAGSTGTGGSSTTAGGKGGTAGAATTGGGAGATGGTAGRGGSGGSGGTGGSAGSGGTGGKTDGGGGTGGSGTDGGLVPDVLTDAPGATLACTDPNGYMDGGGVGTTCVQYCQAYFAVCNANPAVAADAGMGYYTGQDDCVTKCHGFNQAQICCYAVHVNNASLMDASGAAVHCKHAAGLPGNGACPAHP